jgi:hypothetical protein
MGYVMEQKLPKSAENLSIASTKAEWTIALERNQEMCSEERRWKVDESS